MNKKDYFYEMKAVFTILVILQKSKAVDIRKIPAIAFMQLLPPMVKKTVQP